MRNPKELALYYRSLAELLDAGVPVTAALAQVGTQLPGAHGLDLLVEQGHTMSAALRAAPGVFPAAHLQWIAAGEMSGRSTVVLRQLAAFAEESYRMKRRIKSGLAMPAMVFHIGALLGPILGLVRGGTLGGYLWAALGPIVGLWAAVFAGVMLGRHLPPRQVDAFMQNLPWFRELWRELDLWWFSSAMEILTQAGVGVIAALRESAWSCRGGALAEAVRRAADAAEKRGEPASVSLRASGVLPAAAMALWETGEKTGSLDRMLANIARDYAERVEARLQTLAEWSPRFIYGLVAVFMVKQIMGIGLPGAPGSP